MSCTAQIGKVAIAGPRLVSASRKYERSPNAGARKEARTGLRMRWVTIIDEGGNRALRMAWTAMKREADIDACNDAFIEGL